MIRIKNGVLGLAMALVATSVISQAGELSTCLWNGCGVSCSAQADFYKHVNEHTKGSEREDNRFCCKWQGCEKRFALKESLAGHIQTHTGEKLLKCKACGRGFTRKANLKIHIRTHTRERPFKCGTCGKGFAHKSNLSRHAKVHTKVRPFKCEACGKGFARQDHLKSHKNRKQPCVRKSQEASSLGSGGSDGANLMLLASVATWTRPTNESSE